MKTKDELRKEIEQLKEDLKQEYHHHKWTKQKLSEFERKDMFWGKAKISITVDGKKTQEISIAEPYWDEHSVLDIFETVKNLSKISHKEAEEVSSYSLTFTEEIED